MLVPQIFYIFFSEHSRKVASMVNPGQIDISSIFSDANRVYIVYEINRFCMICALIVLMSGGVVQVLRRHKINYIHIFGIQPYSQLTHYQLYNLGMFLTVLFAACLLMQECTDIFNLQPEGRIYEPSFICFVAFWVFLLAPIDHFQKEARFALLQSLLNCLRAPFMKVTFRDFFFADVLCSAPIIFQDITSFGCLASSDDFIKVRHGQCPRAKNFSYFFILLPLWIRLMQCLRRFHDDRKNITQAYNAGKYATSLVQGLFLAAYKIYGGTFLYVITILLRVLATGFSYGWDIYMDWGLLRASNGLRPQITYTPTFYYVASAVDLLLRCTWLIAVILPSENHPWVATFEYATLLAVAELIRRYIWALIRIENEQVSNLEQYRYILEVPELGSTEA